MNFYTPEKQKVVITMYGMLWLALWAAPWTLFVSPVGGEAGRVRGDKVALLVIDVQECFLPGGNLEIQDGEKIIPVINQIREDFKDDLSLVVLSQDWHCPDHVSFASQHIEVTPFSKVDLTYDTQGQLCRMESLPDSFPHARHCEDHAVSRIVAQILWPDHCVQHVTSGPASAAFHESLVVEDSDVIVKKGHICHIDSYSAFFDNGGFTQTELDSVLQEHGIGTVIVTGVALDVCVYYSCKDAHKLGYNVILVTDASRGVAPDTVAAALKDMQETGIVLVEAKNLRTALDASVPRSHTPHTDL